MTQEFSYDTTYILDKSHFSETFDESVVESNANTAYFKSILLAVLGLGVLLTTDVNPYAAWFIVALAAVEALSVRFRKSWWLTRQMLSKTANAEVSISISDHKIHTHSFYADSHILWSEVSQIEATKQGWLIYHPKGKNYLSNRCLSTDAIEFLKGKASEIHEKNLPSQTN